MPRTPRIVIFLKYHTRHLYPKYSDCLKKYPCLPEFQFDKTQFPHHKNSKWLEQLVQLPLPLKIDRAELSGGERI